LRSLCLGAGLSVCSLFLSSCSKDPNQGYYYQSNTIERLLNGGHLLDHPENASDL